MPKETIDRRLSLVAEMLQQAVTEINTVITDIECQTEDRAETGDEPYRRS